MKKLFTLLVGICFSTSLLAQNNVGINTTTPDASAALDVSSTSQGMLVPRMSQAQRNGINLVNGVSTPATGLLIYQTDNTPGFYVYNGTAWTSLNGTQGAKGDKGDPGATGPKGDKGDVGATGPGVPAGGTAGQVLTKVNATDYNTQWTTPSSTYPSIELSTTNTTQQAVSSLFGQATYTTLTLSSNNINGAILTGGNTWDGTTFRVGSNGAGWYQITANFLGVTQGSNGLSNNGYQVVMDRNGTFAGSGSATTGTYPLAFTTYNSTLGSAVLRNLSTLQSVVYLNAGDYLNFRAQAYSTSAAAYTSTEGSSNLTIVRLK